MRERVKQHVLSRDDMQAKPQSGTILMLQESLLERSDRGLGCPFLHSGRVEADEDPLAVSLGGRQPGLLEGLCRHRRDGGRLRRVPAEPSHRSDVAEPVDQDHVLDPRGDTIAGILTPRMQLDRPRHEVMHRRGSRNRPDECFELVALKGAHDLATFDGSGVIHHRLDLLRRHPEVPGHLRDHAVAQRRDSGAEAVEQPVTTDRVLFVRTTTGDGRDVDGAHGVAEVEAGRAALLRVQRLPTTGPLAFPGLGASAGESVFGQRIAAEFTQRSLRSTGVA